MKLHRLISYGLMATGAAVAAKSIFQRRRWEQANIYAFIMLDWDDVQAVATRALPGSLETDNIADLLRHYKENGATHLSIPELSLTRLLKKGQLSTTQGTSTQRVYLQAQSAALADLVATELRLRLPRLEVKRSKGNIISFRGDLSSVAEVGLGFDPAHAELAQQAGLSPVARPIGYSWVQPEMIDRTLNQAAVLGCRIVAVQGTLIPGHEFNIQHTVAAMQRNGLTYAYFRQSRHQKGDWFLAKHLAPSGLVLLAHEFDLPDLLEEDWHTASHRWANLAVEVGVRLCSVRFFKILHAADPLESVAYVQELSRALHRARMSTAADDPIDLTTFQPVQEELSLAGVGLSAAGAAGLAADLLPLPNHLKLVGIAAGAATLAGLPFLGKIQSAPQHDYHHEHDHHHHHDHGHSHGPTLATAYAQKGLALAAAVAYPAAAVSISHSDPATALAHTMVVGAAGVATMTATTVNPDYLLGIEEYRGYNLDWLLPLGWVASAGLFGRETKKTGALRWLRSLAGQKPKSKIPQFPGWGRSWPLVGVTLAGVANLLGKLPADLPAHLDREHRHAHTHHLSEFQQKLGDLKMALSLRPLRKWALLAPLGALCAAIFKQNGRDEWATIALWGGAAGHIATLTGFRQGQRPLDKTLESRLKSWAIGTAVAGVVWLVAQWVYRRK